MASILQNLSEYDPNKMPDASEMSFGIAVSDWNSEITHKLLEGCLETLLKQGVREDWIKLVHVPGSFELPKAAKWLIDTAWEDKDEDLIEAQGIICLGCVITGETRHDEYINHAISKGIMDLNLNEVTPVIFGVLTPNTMEQAKDRAGGKHGNKGVEAAVTAIKMVDLGVSMEPDWEELEDEFLLGLE